MEKQEGVCAMEEDGSSMVITEMETTSTVTVMQQVGPSGESATNTITPLDNPESVEKRLSRKRKYKISLRRQIKFFPNFGYVAGYVAAEKVSKLEGKTEKFEGTLGQIDLSIEIEDTEQKANLKKEDLPNQDIKTSGVPLDKACTSENIVLPSVHEGKSDNSISCSATEGNHPDIQITLFKTGVTEQMKISSRLNLDAAAKSGQIDTEKLKKYFMFLNDENGPVSKEALSQILNNDSGTGPSIGEKQFLPTGDSPNAAANIEEKISELCQNIKKSHLNDSKLEVDQNNVIKHDTAEAVPSTSGINKKIGCTKLLIPSKPKKIKFKIDNDIDDEF